MTVAIATTPRPRQVFNVIDHAHRDIQVANDAVAGRFTLAGVSIDLGRVPDWNSDPYPADKEWRVEWVKFYFGLDLAHAYSVTRDLAYRTAWARLVESFSTQRAPGLDDAEVVARRVQNWIYAWNRFKAVEEDVLDSDLSNRVVRFLWDEVLYVRDHLTKERNHRTLELYALLTASMAFPELDPGHELRHVAFVELHDNLLRDVRPDGVHREASTHYHCIALRSWLGAVRHARDAGVALPASYLTRVTAACDFALHVQRPDGRIPAVSDADGESYRDVLALAAELLGRPDWRWAASLGRSGAPPVRRSVSFPDGGYHVQRSGWGSATTPYEEERFLLFDCGPIGDGGHGHYDLLSVEVFGNGRPLLVDPGRYTYSETGENWRRWFKGTAAHNTVTIDGLDQTPYSRRKPRGVPATGNLLWRVSAPGLDAVCGEATSQQYEVRHVRTVLFIADEYWIVIDDLVGRRPHDFALRWHCAPGPGGEADRMVKVADRPSRVEMPGAVLTFAPARSIRVEPGWYAPSYGVKVAAPVVVIEAHAHATTFVTVIDPRSASPTRAPLRAAFLTRGRSPVDRTVLEVSGVGQTGEQRDLVTWAPAAGFIDLDRFRGVARAAFARRDASGNAQRLTAADVTRASWRDDDGCQAVGPLGTDAWVAWHGRNSELSVGRARA